MKPAANSIKSDTQSIHFLPRWITRSGGETTDTVAFSSGAALAMLDVVLRDPEGALPSELLRDRMALEAAVACLKLENRREVTSDIRGVFGPGRGGVGAGGGHVCSLARVGADQSDSIGVERSLDEIIAGAGCRGDA